MDKERLPKKSAKGSFKSRDDIPEALRDISNVEKKSSLLKPVLIVLGLLALGGSTFLTAGWLFLSKSQSLENDPLSASSPQPISNLEKIATATNEPDNLLGHLTYDEAPESDLQAITRDGRIRMRNTAAEKFRQMEAAAKAQGVILAPISGFRSVGDQQHLFFKVKEQRGQITTKRAEVSAPPGYSEHHTGYAIDIGDGKTPATNLSTSFENTAAFRWLEKNAAYYSFELSFPHDNPQGISYEPWHWRFVGDRHSLETFYKARNIQQSQK